MTKSDLIDAIAATTGESKAATERVIDALPGVIADALAKGEDIAIPRLGTFNAKRRAERPGRNPQTGDAITIPAKTVPTFRPASALREAVHGT